jgi:hypothetical protein
MNYIARWDGTDWHSLSSGLDFYGQAVEWVEGKLYVGGQFSQAGGIPSSKLAAWATEPDFALLLAQPVATVCPGDDAFYSIDVAAYNNYNDPVTLSAEGNPPGTTAVFGQNPVTPPGSSNLTIGSTAGIPSGSYDIDIVGVATTRTHTTTVELNILLPPPQAPSLFAPADGATDVPNQPDFSWSSSAGASHYLLEIATDAAFNTVVYSRTVTGLSHTAETLLEDGTEYFWRVIGENSCGSGPVSATFSFTTILPVSEFKIYLPAVES